MTTLKDKINALKPGDVINRTISWGKNGGSYLPMTITRVSRTHICVASFNGIDDPINKQYIFLYGKKLYVHYNHPVHNNELNQYYYKTYILKSKVNTKVVYEPWKTPSKKYNIKLAVLAKNKYEAYCIAVKLNPDRIVARTGINISQHQIKHISQHEDYCETPSFLYEG